MIAIAPMVADRAVMDADRAEVPLSVRGAIVDSWVEPAGSCGWDSRVVLQVAPRGRFRELVTVEAEATLLSDLGWLADLGENLCHGCPIRIEARVEPGGTIEVTDLELDR